MFQDNDFPHSTEFYPGQSLWGPVHCLEEAQWIQCTKEMKAKRKLKPQKITKVMVEKVETDWVGVHWQCRAYSKDGAWSDQAQPKFVVEGEDLRKLRLLNVFEPSTVQVGDRNFYVIKGDENVITREQWRKQQRDIFQVPKQSPRKTRPIITVTKLPDDKRKEPRKEKTTEPQQRPADENAQNNSINAQDATTGNNSLLPPPQAQHAESSDEWDTEDTTGSQSDTASVITPFLFSLLRVGITDLFGIDSDRDNFALTGRDSRNRGSDGIVPVGVRIIPNECPRYTRTQTSKRARTEMICVVCSVGL